MRLDKPYIMGVSSQKGGVGKTTLSVNLSVALKGFGYRVLLIDSDISNPSVAFHLGLEKVNIGYKNVLYGKSDLEDATVVHAPTGLHVLPGTIDAKPFNPGQANIPALGDAVKKTNYDFVIFDTAPGFVEEDLSDYYGEALILTTPEMSACTSSIRLAHQYDSVKVRHNMVVNRIKNKNYELSIGEIEDIYEKKVLGSIPEDEIVMIGVAEHIPAYLLNPNSKFANSIRVLVQKYSLMANPAATNPQRPRHSGIIGFLRRLFGLD